MVRLGKCQNCRRLVKSPLSDINEILAWGTYIMRRNTDVTLASIVLPLAAGLISNLLTRSQVLRGFFSNIMLEIKIAAGRIEPISISDVHGATDNTIRSNLNTGSAVAMLAKLSGAREVFEFGTYLGETTMAIAENCPECRIVTLDLPDNTEFEDAVTTSTVYMTDSNLFAVNARGQKIAGAPAARITQIREDSGTFDETKYLGRFDLIYIDASHSYSAVKSDSEKGLRMLKPSGTVIWDDYMYPGIWKYLNELARQSPDLRLRYIRGTGKVVALGTALTLNASA